MTKSIALYARVSSERQVRQATIESQLAALRARAAQDGCVVLPSDEYVDNGHSGSSLRRPALERLRDRVSQGAVDLVYAHSPDRLARRVERQAHDVDRQWTLRVERARYEAHLAERRYKAVDPDNRVVARSLEREWNDKLVEVERLEREQTEARERDKLVVSDEDRAQIMSLARDLPRIWNAETTTHAERKNLLRMLIREVSLHLVDVPSRQTRVRVLWQTGAVSDLLVERPPKSAWSLPRPEVPALIAELFAAGKSDDEIAAEVQRRGLLPARRKRWSAYSVRVLRLRQGLRRPARVRTEAQRSDGLLSLRGVAMRLGVSLRTVRHWVEQGLLVPTEQGRGRPRWFTMDDATLRRLEPLVRRVSSGSRPRSPRREEAL